jgi:hypothetical protein
MGVRIFVQKTLYCLLGFYDGGKTADAIDAKGTARPTQPIGLGPPSSLLAGQVVVQATGFKKWRSLPEADPLPLVYTRGSVVGVGFQ